MKRFLEMPGRTVASLVTLTLAMGPTAVAETPRERLLALDIEREAVLDSIYHRAITENLVATFNHDLLEQVLDFENYNAEIKQISQSIESRYGVAVLTNSESFEMGVKTKAHVQVFSPRDHLEALQRLEAEMSRFPDNFFVEQTGLKRIILASEIIDPRTVNTCTGLKPKRVNAYSRSNGDLYLTFNPTKRESFSGTVKHELGHKILWNVRLPYPENESYRGEHGDRCQDRLISFSEVVSWQSGESAIEEQAEIFRLMLSDDFDFKTQVQMSSQLQAKVDWWKQVMREKGLGDQFWE